MLDCIGDVAREFARARLVYGHGTDNPEDEAAALVLSVLGLDYDALPVAYAHQVSPADRARIGRLAARRIRERIPVAYLTGRTWFAGLEMRVTRDVLVPRSPLAELCETGFSPWAHGEAVRAVLDIGTGSGCIAIACARAFPRARVDAADVSARALAVAAGNIHRHRLKSRVRAVRSDVYTGIGRRRYDIIVSNPPYVSSREMRALPREYRHEPALGLAAGRLGLDVVARILGGAREHLRDAGVLVVEVGDTQREVERMWRDVPFTWLEFERGGGGVFLLTAAQLDAARVAINLGAVRVTERVTSARRASTEARERVALQRRAG
jgi:ribosomal protein L3 glutamine methyltransferase